MMWKPTAEHPIRVFDYWWYDEYEDENGVAHRSYHRRTCATAEVGWLWPQLSLTKEGIIGKAAAALGARDIEFESEEFNRTFFVTCEDRRFANAFLDAQMIDILAATKRSRRDRSQEPLDPAPHEATQRTGVPSAVQAHRNDRQPDPEPRLRDVAPVSTIWIVLGIAAVVFVLLAISYNRFASQTTLMANSWSNVDTELRRHDLVPNLVETVHGYAGHEQRVLVDVTEARSAARSATGEGAEHNRDEAALSGALRC